MDQTNVEVRQVRVAVSEVSQTVVLHDDQIGKLKNALTELRDKFDKLQLKTRRGPDDSFERIVFLGLLGVSYDQRIEHMSKYKNSISFVFNALAQCISATARERTA